MELYPHQTDALKRMKNGCVLKGGVGSGKSRTAVHYYRENEYGRPIYVITTAKKRDDMDWQTEFNEGLFKVPPGAEMMDKLIVDSWNNIAKYLDVKDAFFIFDEQRAIGSGKWAKTFVKIAKKNRWVMLSATPGDTWMDYISVFVANGFYKNRTEFKRTHVIYNAYTKFPKVERYIGIPRLIRNRKKVLVEMPYERHTTRHENRELCEYDEELYKKVWKDRWHVYEDRPLTNAAEMMMTLRKVVNSDPSRLEMVRTLLAKHSRLICFYNFDFELEALRGLSEITDVAEWNGHLHQDIPVLSSSWLYLVQYTAGSEGWNCTTTDSMVFYSQTYSYRHWHQSKGRIDRLNTPFNDLYYYNLISRSPIDLAIGRALREKKDFNERKFRGSRPWD